MTLSKSYLKQKVQTTNSLMGRLDALAETTTHKDSLLRESKSAINGLREGLKVKSKVLVLLESLHNEGNYKHSDASLKAINRAMFFAANKPNFPKEKLLKSVERAGFDDIQYNAVSDILDDILSKENKGDRIQVAKKMMTQIVRERSSRLNPRSIENIVLAGGGAKGFSLARIPSALENGGATNLKRIAGTSAGALLGSLMAFGYSGNELEDIILNNQFGIFTKNSRLSTPFVDHVASGNNSVLLKPFSDNAYATEYHQLYISELLCQCAINDIELPMSIGEDIKSYYEINMVADESMPEEATPDEIIQIREQMLDHRRGQMKLLFNKVVKPLIKTESGFEKLEDTIINKLPDSLRREASNAAARMTELTRPSNEMYFHQFYPSTIQAARSALRDVSGRDLIVGMLQDLMVEKLKALPDDLKREVFLSEEERTNHQASVSEEKLRNINFKQLKKLHDKRPQDFKEFYCTIAIKKPLTERIKGLLTASYQRYSHHDVSHLDAEFNQMSVADAVRVSMNLPGIYPAYPFEVKGKKYEGADGGVISNLSIQVFDDDHPPEKTMCVIYASESKLKQADNLYQILMHPRSKSEIEREIQLLRLRLSEITEKRQKLSRIIHSQYKKIPGPNNNVMRQKLIHEAEQRMEKIELTINNLRFRRQVLENELENTKVRSILPMSLQDSLASKRHRGQYLPQDLNRTVLINTGEINTLDFKATMKQKSTLIKSGEKSVRDVLEGRDDLELHFVRSKCEEFEYAKSLDSLSVVKHFIYANKKPDHDYYNALSYMLQTAIPSFEDLEKRNDYVDKINELLQDTSLRANKAMRLARSAWNNSMLTGPTNSAAQY